MFKELEKQLRTHATLIVDLIEFEVLHLRTSDTKILENEYNVILSNFNANREINISKNHILFKVSEGGYEVRDEDGYHLLSLTFR